MTNKWRAKAEWRRLAHGSFACGAIGAAGAAEEEACATASTFGFSASLGFTFDLKGNSYAEFRASLLSTTTHHDQSYTIIRRGVDQLLRDGTGRAARYRPATKSL